MRIRVCGCSGGETRDRALTAFLLEGGLALDAGSLTRALTLEEQEGIGAILLSHAHLDHVKDLAFLADNLFARRPGPIPVYGLEGTLAAVSRHLLNGLIWFDPTRLPTPEEPVYRFHPVAPAVPFGVLGWEAEAVPVNHSVPAAGWLLRRDGAALAYTGDTGATERFWQVLGETAGLAGLIAEVSFPDRLAGLARETGHMTPALLAAALGRLPGRRFPVFLSHLKPDLEEEIRAELAALALPGCRLLAMGEELELSPP